MKVTIKLTQKTTLMITPHAIYRVKWYIIHLIDFYSQQR